MHTSGCARRSVAQRFDSHLVLAAGATTAPFAGMAGPTFAVGWATSCPGCAPSLRGSRNARAGGDCVDAGSRAGRDEVRRYAGALGAEPAKPTRAGNCGNMRSRPTRSCPLAEPHPVRDTVNAVRLSHVVLASLGAASTAPRPEGRGSRRAKGLEGPERQCDQAIHGLRRWLPRRSRRGKEREPAVQIAKRTVLGLESLRRQAAAPR